LTSSTHVYAYDLSRHHNRIKDKPKKKTTEKTKEKLKTARKKCPVVANSMGFWSVYKKSIKERAVAKNTLKVFGNSSLPKKGTIKRKEITLT
jgi:hypothetical protein